MTIASLRADVVAEAMSWLRTPYHHTGRVKGAGADCVTLIIEVYSRCGIIENFTPPFYPVDFMVHRGDEIYLDGMLKYARQVEVPQPGDIAMYRFGRCISHAGIVVEWPKIIHAHMAERQVTMSEGDKGNLVGRLHGFFSLFGGD